LWESYVVSFVFFFQAEDGIRDFHVTGVQTCALPISARGLHERAACGAPGDVEGLEARGQRDDGRVRGAARDEPPLRRRGRRARRSEERRVGKEGRSQRAES